MPTLYPNNTGYGPNTNVFDPSSVASALAGIRKAREAQVSQSKVSKGMIPTALSSRDFLAATKDPAAPEGYQNFEGQVGHEFTNKFTNISDYVKKSGIPYDMKTGSEREGTVTPSDQARFVNLSSGGQYVNDPTQPGALIKSDRGENAAGKRTAEDYAILGSLNPNLYQIDHIVPLWAGGSNTLDNKQVIDTGVEHANKTKVQSVPFTLLNTINPATGKPYISIREAQAMAINWKDRDAEDIKTFSEGASDGHLLPGMVNIQEALQLKKEWDEGPSFMRDLASHPIKTIGGIFGGMGEAARQITGKLGKEAEEVGMPEPVAQFVQGFSSGLLFNTGYEQKEGGMNKAAGMAGTVAGNVAQYALFLKTLGLLAKGGQLALGGAVEKKVAELAVKAGVGDSTQAMQKYGQLANSVKTADQLAVQNAGKVKGLWDTNKAGQVMSKQKMDTIGTWSDIFKKQIPTQVAFGQIQSQEDAPRESGVVAGWAPRATRAFEDALFGLGLGAFGHNSAMATASNKWLRRTTIASGYPAVGVGSFLISKMTGQSDDDALVNSLINVGFHGVAHPGAAKEAKFRADIYANQVKDRARQQLSLWDLKLPEKFDQKSADRVLRKTSNAIIELQKVNGETDAWRDQQIKNTRAYINFLAKMELPPKLRDEAFATDMQSIHEAVSGFSDKSDFNAPKTLINWESTQDIMGTKAKLKSTDQIHPLTGTAKQTNSKAQERIKLSEEALNANKHSGVVVFVQRNDLAPFFRWKSQEPLSAADIKRGKTQDAHPENNLHAYTYVLDEFPDRAIPDGAERITDGAGTKLIRIDTGYSPTAERIGDLPGINGRSDSFNNTTKQRYITKGMTPEQIAAEGGLFDATLNKDSISDNMRKEGIDILPTMLEKVTSKTLYSNQPFSMVSISPESYAEAREAMIRMSGKKKAASKFSAVEEIKHKPTDKDLVNDLADYTHEPMTGSERIITYAEAEMPVESRVYSQISKRFEDGIKTEDAATFKRSIDGIYGDGFLPLETAERMISEGKATTADIIGLFTDAANNQSGGNVPNFILSRFLKPLFKDSLFAQSDAGNLYKQTNILGNVKVKNHEDNLFAIQRKSAQLEKELFGETKKPTIDDAEKLLADNPEARKLAEDVANAPEIFKNAETPRSKPSGNKAIDTINDIIADRVTEPASVKVVSKALNRPVIDALVQEVKATGGTKDARRGLFVSRMEELISDTLGTDYTFSSKQVKDMSKYYRDASSRQLHNVITIDGDKKITVAPLSQKSGNTMGKIDESTSKLATELGLKEDEISLASINKQSIITDSNTPDKKSYNEIEKHDLLRDKIEKFNREDNGEHLLFVGKKGKDIGSYTFAKLSKAAKSKMLEKFNKDPNAYVDTAENVKLLSDDEKLTHVWYKDVVGNNKLDAADATKRASLLYNRFHQVSSANLDEPVKMWIFQSPTVKELGSMEPERISNMPGNEALWAEKENTPLFDGSMFAMEGLHKKLNKGNYDKAGKLASKPIINALTPEGIEVQKGMIRKSDSVIKAFIEKKYGVKLGNNDLISFTDNAKIRGKKITSDNPSDQFVNIKLGDIYLKSSSFKEGATLSPSMITKFLEEHGLNPTVDKLSKERVASYKTLVDDISSANSGKEALDTLEKYADKYGLDKEAMFYGVKIKMFEQGAWKKLLGHEIDKTLKNIVANHIVSENISGANKMYITPNLPLPLDGPGTAPRFLKTNEVLVSAEQAKKMGVQEGDYVLMGRNPVTDLNNLSKNRIIIADKFGLEYGKDFVSTAPHDVIMKKDADYDGDSVFMFKLGGEGLPEEFGNAVEKFATKDTLIPGKLKRDKVALSPSGLWDAARNQTYGDALTPKVSSLLRSLNMIQDNKLSMKISGNKVELFTGDSKVPVHTVTLDYYIKTKGPVTVKFRTGENERTLLRAMQSEAIDSSSNKRLEERIAGDMNHHVKQIIDASDASGKDIPAQNVLSAVKSGLLVLSEPFNAIKGNSKFYNPDQLIKAMQPHIEYARNVEKQGGKLTPQQVLFKNLEDIKGIGFKKDANLSAEDAAATKAVKEKFSDSEAKKNFDNKNYSDTAKEAMTRVLEIKNLSEPKSGKPWTLDEKKSGTKIKDAKLKEFRKWLEKVLEEDGLSASDKSVLSYWAAGSQSANMKQHATWQKAGSTSKYIHRPDELITLDDDIAKTFYDTFENTPGITDNSNKLREVIKRRQA